MSLKKLHQSSFSSLTKAGFDWYSFIKTQPKLEKDYYNYLDLKAKKCIINTDYSQLECYVLASLSGDQKFIDVVNSGKDVHSSNVTNVYGLVKEDIERNLEEAIKCNNFELIHAYESDLESFKTKRKFIKALTFALAYGAGAGTIANNLRISTEDANKLIDDFYNTYPRIREWQKETVLFAIRNGYIETRFGRQRATPLLYNSVEAYNAFVLEKPQIVNALKKNGSYWTLRQEVKVCLNTPIQSLASDMATKAFCISRKKFKRENRLCKPLFFVHDSIVMSADINNAVEDTRDLMSIMENDVKYDGDPVNYRVAAEFGYNYEYVTEVDRDILLSDKFTVDFIKETLTKSLDHDLNRKLKLIVKSSSGNLMDAEGYIGEIKEAKQAYFEKMLEDMGFTGHTPLSYMAYMNGMTTDDYETYFMSELRRDYLKHEDDDDETEDDDDDIVLLEDEDDTD